MRPVQRFSDAYLARCREMTHEEIARFLEDFRLLHGGGRPGPAPSHQPQSPRTTS